MSIRFYASGGKTLYVILEANIDTFYRAKKEKKPDWLEETPEHEKEE